jgi:protein TonB
LAQSTRTLAATLGTLGISVPFAVAMSISIVFHSTALFGLRFVLPDARQIDTGARPLQVVLVNSKSARRPLKADALAQANLDGGGNTDAKTVATSPFPVLKDAEPQPELKTRLQQVHELEQQQARLLTQIKAKPMLEKPAPVARPQQQLGQTPDADDLMARSFEIARLEAQIARDHNAYQTRPKRKNIGARVEEYRFARYIEDWRLKIERVGNLNYPEEARQKKLYGSLQLTVHIKSDGSLDGVDVDRSSGSKILDEAAVRIVKLASPYAAFPEDIRRDYDILDVTRTWTFTRSDQLAGE